MNFKYKVKYNEYYTMSNGIRKKKKEIIVSANSKEKAKSIVENITDCPVFLHNINLVQ